MQPAPASFHAESTQIDRADGRLVGKAFWSKVKLATLAAVIMLGAGAAPALAQSAWAINVDNSHFNPVPAGGLADYSVRIDNSDNVASAGTTVTFTIPSASVYEGVTGFSNCAPTPDAVPAPTVAPVAVTCEVPVIQPGASILGKVNVRHLQEGTATLKSSIAGGPSFDRRTTVQRGADLSVELAAAPSPIQAGNRVTMTATVTNHGPYASSGGSVVLTLPTGLSPDVQMPAGCSINAELITCALEELAPGASVDLDFTTQVTAANASTATASATVMGGAPRDPSNANDSGLADIVILEGTDVTVRKTRAPLGLMLLGDSIAFTVQPQVAGRDPSAARITDTVPVNYAIDRVDAGAGWTCGISGQAITCDYVEAPGSDYHNPIVIHAEAVMVTGAGGVTNTASISTPDENDSADADNTDTDDVGHIAKPTIDMVAHKSGPPRGLVTVGNAYDFELWADNQGNTSLGERLTITDLLPDGLTINAVAAPGGWTCSPLPVVGPGTLECYTDDYVETPLGVGESTPVITVTAEVTQEGTFRNGMRVSFDDYGNRDGEPGDNTVLTGELTSAAGTKWADLSVDKTIVAPVSGSLISGDEITFRIEIVNSGPAVAEDVRLVDELADIVAQNGGTPGPIVPVTTNGLVCTVSNETTGYSRSLQCTVAQLAQCTAGVDCPTVEVTVRPGGQGARQNTASAYSYSTPDNDTENNISSVDYTVTPRTDVTVTKATTAEAVGAAVGQELTYVITAQVPDLGLSAAESVSIVDTLPDGVRFLRATPSAGTCSVTPAAGAIVSAAGGNNLIRCNLGTIGNRSQQTVSVTVVPTMSVVNTDIVNSVIVSTTTPEIDPDNNDDDVTVRIHPPVLDLEIQKRDLIDPVEIATDTTYRITVTNSGPSDASNVQMVDTLPISGLANPRLVGPLPDGWSCSLAGTSTTVPGGTVTCTAALLPARTSVDLDLTMTAVARQRHANNVSVTSAETLAGYDIVPDNNTSREDTTVRVRADLQVTKTPSVAVVDLRQEFYWDLDVAALSGGGLDVAEAVVLTDDFPPGMVLTRAPQILQPAATRSCTGAAGSTSITCQLDEIAPGQNVTVRVWVKIVSVANAGDEVVNTARASTLSFDRNPDNDSDEGSVTTVRASSISGTIYRDFNNDGLETAGRDSGISNVEVLVSGTSLHDGVAISASARTDSSGNYSVTDLPPGTYSVAYTTASITETHLANGRSILGTDSTGPTAGTIVDHRSIGNVVTTTTTSGTDYDFTLIPTARIGLSKSASAPSFNTDGSYSITYTLTAKNFSIEPVGNIVITDLLSAANRNFGSHHAGAGNPPEGSYKITAVTDGAFGTPNSSFTGQAGADQLLGSGVLTSGATGTVRYTIRVNPAVPRLQGLNHTNQAVVTGSGQYSGQTSATNPQLSDPSNSGTNPDTDNDGIGNEAADNVPTVVTPNFSPSITIDKTAVFTPSGTPEVADTIQYTFVVTNNGKTPLVGVTVSDPLPGLSALSGPAQPLRLEPSATATFTATYALTQADLDYDAVNNTATATGQWGVTGGGTPVTVTDTDDATVPDLADPALTIDKAISSTTVANPSVLGQTITYAFTVTNTGNTNLRDVRVVDPLLGADPALVIGALARGASTTVYATYSIDQDDLDAGAVNNTAKATGSYGPPATPKTVDSPNDSASQPVHQNPAVTLNKAINPASVPTSPRAGNVLTWTVTATNSGNVTLTNLRLTDPMPGAVVTPASHASVAPGRSVAFTVTAPLAQSSINAGEVENEATLNFNTPTGGGTPVKDDETVPLAQLPAIQLTKQMVTAITDPLVPGSTLRYRFTILNIGNLPLGDISLDDDLPGFVLDTGAAASLAAAVLQPQNAAGTVPLADRQVVVEGVFAVDQADIDAGEVVNEATAEGVPTHGPDTPVTDTDEVTTSLTRDPQIRLIKSVTDAPTGAAQAGDVVTYGFAVHNTGNVVLSSISLTELLIGSDILNPTNWDGPLAPGDIVDDVFTATYELTQADINRGYVENSAQVSGSGLDAGGVPATVTDTSGATVDDDQPTRVTLVSATGLQIVKSAEETLRTPPLEGDTIDYSFVVTNTGNLTLYDVEISDPLLSSTVLHTIPELQPGAANAFTFGPVTYSVAQDDIQAGHVTNTANAAGTYVDPVTLVDTPISSPSNEVIVPLDQEPGLAVVKEAVASLNDPTTVGEQIEYYFEVTNTGNVVIDNVTVTDPLAGLTPPSYTLGTMQPGATLRVGPSTYSIVQDDLDRRFVINQATASGTYDIGDGPEPISDLSGPTVPTDEELVVPMLPIAPVLEIVKQAEFVGSGGSYALVGDRIDFSFEITNRGNVPIADVQPEEVSFLFGGTPSDTPVTDFVPASVTLLPGESEIFTASYVLTQNDLNAGAGIPDGVQNTARAIGVANGTIDVESPTDTATLTLNPQPPSDVTITKSTNRPTIHRGETVPFVIEVQNNSLANAGRVTIVDRIPSGFVFVEGSASVNGAAFVPTIDGNDITFADLPLGALQRIEIGLVLRALPGTPPGRYRNLAIGLDELGGPLGPDAQAFVEIVPDAVFDCSDVIGTVFDDRNGNRYQDEGEPGIPGVRLSTVRGLLVTSDAFGRFSIPCAAIPDATIGSNFVLKLDAATLPTGFAVTTDNPAMVRVTPGKMVEINFGAQIGRKIRISVNADAFAAGTNAPNAELEAGLEQLISVLAEQKAHLHIVYQGSGAEARTRAGILADAIRERWRGAGAPYSLVIDTTIEER